MNKNLSHVSLGEIIMKSEKILKDHYSTKIPPTWTTQPIDKHGSSYVTLCKIAKTVSNNLPIDILKSRKVISISPTDYSVIRYKLDLIESLILPELVVFYYIKLNSNDIWKYFENDFHVRIMNMVSDKKVLQYLANHFKDSGPIAQFYIDDAQARLVYDLSFFFLKYAFVDVPNKQRTQKKKKDGTIQMTAEKHISYPYRENVVQKYPEFQGIIDSIHPNSKWIHDIWPMFVLDDSVNANKYFELFSTIHGNLKQLLSTLNDSPKCSNSWKYYRRHSRITVTNLNKVNDYLTQCTSMDYAIPHGIIRDTDHTLFINLEFEIARFTIDMMDSFKDPLPSPCKI